MPVHIDQLQRSITLAQTPLRIVSLVPSITELLYDLGLEEKVVGITKFCVHPRQWFISKTRVGGTKSVKIEAVHALKPDLIIASKEENVREQIDLLGKYYSVWISDIKTLQDTYQLIDQLGVITGSSDKAVEIIRSIQKEFAALGSIKARKKACYLIWRNPYLTVGGDTFIHHLLDICGFENIFGHLPRYPEIKMDQVMEANCDLVLLSSEPFPFKEKHIADLEKLLPNARIVLVDGELFSWYGSRLLYAPRYFKELISTAGMS
jgi:ABC-type Fe3+-hydroxamate transport system substrate-binding protein